MSYYQKAIIEITGATADDAKQTEEFLRAQYGTLNHLSDRQFRKDVAECYRLVIWLKTPEGSAYLAEVEKEILSAT